MARVIIGQRQRVDLRAQDVLGSGGEGTVFRVSLPGGLVAIKVYHQPNLRRGTKLQALQILNQSFPPEVVGPQELVWEVTRRRIIGFVMRLLSAGHDKFETLLIPRHRQANAITTKDVTELFIRLYGVLQTLHKLGVVVGDLNSFNILYRIPLQVALIDVDSFQFGHYPCGVATERFLNPRLYQTNLSLRPMFKPEDDWYSFLVLFFNSLLLVHPYGGAHRLLRTVTRRALSHVWVFDSSVTYPAVAYSPEVISDELLQFFSDTFAQGKTKTPDLGLLQGYVGDLIECPTCNLWYPHYRQECPGCQAINRQALRMKVQVIGVRVMELLATQGSIVFFKLIGATMYAVAIEKGEAVLYIKEQLETPKRMVLFRAPRGARYDIFGKYLVVCPRPYDDQPQLVILDFSKGQLVKVTATVTERFGNRGGVFRGTAKCLYRTVGGVLLRGQIPFGQDLVDEVVATTMEKQTWFDAAPGRGRELLFGFYRVFSRHDWFQVLDGVQHLVQIPVLEKGEAMVDRSIRFSSSSILLLRRTRRRGEDFCRIDVVDTQSADVVSSRRVSLRNNPQFVNIHNVAYGKGTILIPSNDGLLAENARTGNQKLFPKTANFVDEGCQLWPYENGILVISGNNRVLKIVMV